MSELTRTRRLLLVPAACALVVAATAACGASGAASSGGTSSAMSGMSSSSSGASGMAATGTTLMIQKFAYKTPASVSPGAKVQIMNMDGEVHTVTADEGNAFDVTAPSGKTVSFSSPTKPGTYRFHCTFLTNMHGVLV